MSMHEEQEISQAISDHAHTSVAFLYIAECFLPVSQIRNVFTYLN